MKSHTTIALAVAAALATTLGASSAQAATISFDTTTPVSLTLTDWNSNLLFHKFDTSLGTLTSVTLDFSTSLQTVITVTNSSASASSGTAQTELQVTVTDGGTNHLNTPEIDALSTAFGYSLAPGANTQSGTLTKNSSSHDVYTAGVILAEFSGTGNISLPISTFTQTLLANTGGNTAAAQTTQASATGTVTYTYTPVPEPTVALLGLTGLGMVAGFKRRRQA